MGIRYWSGAWTLTYYYTSIYTTVHAVLVHAKYVDDGDWLLIQTKSYSAICVYIYIFYLSACICMWKAVVTLLASRSALKKSSSYKVLSVNTYMKFEIACCSSLFMRSNSCSFYHFHYKELPHSTLRFLTAQYSRKEETMEARKFLLYVG
jgi:hypothetical protein